MKKLLILLTMLPVVAFGGSANKEVCVNTGPQISAQGMDSSQSFEITGSPSNNFGLASVLLDLTDANTSITSFDMSCVGKVGLVDDEFTLQSCATSAGVCTSSDASWAKASPGTAKWVWRVDMEGIQTLKCTLSVGAGTGTGADLLTARVRLCTKG